MEITIRKGVKKDLDCVLELIKELADYENELNEVKITTEDLENDGFGVHPYYWFLVAENKGQIIGLSFYWIRYSTWKGKLLYLEDFIVKNTFRRLGVGAALFEATLKTCKELNLNGMCWQVLDWNTPAINFYHKYGAEISNAWLDGKLTKQQIEKFCSQY